ncbi:hypothetical protein QWZ03_02280 [Chitinimonas viridis]|uniref:Uncharacterized protein n=1 Tax=Chitinimonas viridis TaxID=664880 RepID=A0ABT8B0M4_9NEIS|nr:hypothetical protein [Chitinimonas viridis]MDN3575599.1 hypothetical protein [Chitinimonas viridis]
MQFNKITAVLCLATSLTAAADIAIDSTGAAVQFAGKDSLQVNNLHVPGYGNYSLRFKWDPVSLSFVYDPATLTLASQSRCSKQVYQLSDTFSEHIQASTRMVDGVEYGGLSDVATKSLSDWTVTNVWTNFTVVWAKTALQADNPYLKGQTVANFDPNKGYGFVSTYGDYGFKHHDLVEVGGNLDTEDFLLVKQVNGSNTAIFNKGARRTGSFGCASNTGTYYEHSTSKASVVMAGDTAALTSGYNTLKTSWSISTGVGSVGASSDSRTKSTHDYGGLEKGDKLLVRDIGNGFSMVAVDESGKVLGSHLVMTMY